MKNTVDMTNVDDDMDALMSESDDNDIDETSQHWKCEDATGRETITRELPEIRDTTQVSTGHLPVVLQYS
jgi:hypothetical protein